MPAKSELKSLCATWILLWGVVTHLGSTNVAAAAESPAIASLDNTALGFASRQGECLIWMTFDTDVKAGENGIKLPLRYQYSSNPSKVSNPCLGAGWWFPLLESTVVAIDERSVMMNAVGGKPFRFYKDPKDPLRYVTRDFQYVGYQKSPSSFEVTGKDGWQFNYRSGRLQEVQTPRGESVTWVYDKDRVTSIVSQKLGELLRAKYSDAGLIEEIRYNDGKGWMKFSYDACPIISREHDLPSIVRLVPTLSRIQESDGSVEEISAKPTDDLREMKLAIQFTGKTGAPREEYWMWDTASKFITSDYTGRYSLEFPEEHQTVISRFLPGGKSDRYSYNLKTGVLDITDPGGKIQRTHYVLTPGPAFGQSSKIMASDGKGPFVPVMRKYFDAEGACIRKDTSPLYYARKAIPPESETMEVQWFNKAGAAIKLPADANSTMYDEKGRVVLEVAKGIRSEFEYLEGGQTRSKTVMPNGASITKLIDQHGKLLQIEIE